MLLQHTQKQPQTIPPKHSPQWPSRRNSINAKNQAKTKISSKTLTCMAVKAKPNQKSTQNPPSKRSRQWPCSFNLFPLGKKNAPPPLAELYEMTMFCASNFCEITRQWSSPPSTPCTDKRCGRILSISGHYGEPPKTR